MATTRVLVVDDDALSLAKLVRLLEKVGIQTVLAQDGVEALALLREHPDAFDVLLLDLVMPKLSGIQVLEQLKANSRLSHIPVILQTASNSPDEIARGLRAGAYFYLTKPLVPRLVQAVVATAAEVCARHRVLQLQVEQAGCPLALMQEGTFRFQTLAQCHELSNLLAKICPDPARIVPGLSELLINALEHGNLGITYQDKTELLEGNRWRNEVHRRQNLPENRDKWVRVGVQRLPAKIRFEVSDQGPGFDWLNYIQPSPSRVFDNHGRGIFMAKLDSFDTLNYEGTGNRVVAEVHLVP